jgi:hypothetical protein
MVKLWQCWHVFPPCHTRFPIAGEMLKWFSLKAFPGQDFFESLGNIPFHSVVLSSYSWKCLTLNPLPIWCYKPAGAHTKVWPKKAKRAGPILRASLTVRGAVETWIFLPGLKTHFTLVAGQLQLWTGTSEEAVLSLDPLVPAHFVRLFQVCKWVLETHIRIKKDKYHIEREIERSDVGYTLSDLISSDMQ